MNLNDEESKRYDRHIRLAGFGLTKQLKLKESRVLLIGAGGLGCPIGLYLAASGVGHIGIADDDKIELSNLQRQIAFSVNDLGKSKADTLKSVILKLNSLIDVTAYPFRIDSNNIEKLISNYDLVIDGTDNFATRFLLADVCFLHKIGYLHASVHQYQGQLALFLPGITPCFRCLYRQAPSSSALPPCTEAGILGIVTGAVGTMAAVEAIKHLTGLGKSIAGKVLIYDALKQESKKFDLESDQNCPLCSKNATIINMEIVKNNQQNLTNCTVNNIENNLVITLSQAVELLKTTSLNEKPLLIDVREQHEYREGHMPDAISLPLSILQHPSNTVFSQLKAHKKTILCYCQKGTRSLKAVSLLRENDFLESFSIEGGIEAWYAQQSS